VGNLDFRDQLVGLNCK